MSPGADGEWQEAESRESAVSQLARAREEEGQWWGLSIARQGGAVATQMAVWLQLACGVRQGRAALRERRKKRG